MRNPTCMQLVFVYKITIWRNLIINKQVCCCCCYFHFICFPCSEWSTSYIVFLPFVKNVSTLMKLTYYLCICQWREKFKVWMALVAFFCTWLGFIYPAANAIVLICTGVPFVGMLFSETRRYFLNLMFMQITERNSLAPCGGTSNQTF